MASTTKNSVKVVVTGGNGFLGQHIVKLLQVKSSLDIEEIIVFDQEPFKQALGLQYFSFLQSVQNINNFFVIP